MTEQDMAREVAWEAHCAIRIAAYTPSNPPRLVGYADWSAGFDAAWAAGVAHGRAEAWREIEVIAGDSLPRDWGRIAREVREVRG